MINLRRNMLVLLAFVLALVAMPAAAQDDGRYSDPVFTDAQRVLAQFWAEQDEIGAMTQIYAPADLDYSIGLFAENFDDCTIQQWQASIDDSQGEIQIRLYVQVAEICWLQDRSPHGDEAGDAWFSGFWLTEPDTWGSYSPQAHFQGTHHDGTHFSVTVMDFDGWADLYSHIGWEHDWRQANG